MVLIRRKPPLKLISEQLKQYPWAVAAVELSKEMSDTLNGEAISSGTMRRYIMPNMGSMFTIASFQYLSDVYFSAGRTKRGRFRSRRYGVLQQIFLVGLNEGNLYQAQFCTRMFFEYFDFIIERDLRKAALFFKVLYLLWKNGPLTSGEIADKVSTRGNPLEVLMDFGAFDSKQKGFPYLVRTDQKGRYQHPRYDLSPVMKHVFHNLFDAKTRNEWNFFKENYRIKNLVSFKNS